MHGGAEGEAPRTGNIMCPRDGGRSIGVSDVVELVTKFVTVAVVVQCQ